MSEAISAAQYALCRNELAADCPDPSVLEALIFRTYQNDLRNLAGTLPPQSTQGRHRRTPPQPDSKDEAIAT